MKATDLFIDRKGVLTFPGRKARECRALQTLREFDRLPLLREALECPDASGPLSGSRFQHFRKSIPGALLGMAMSLLLIGCASVNNSPPKDPSPTLVWPEPPAQPRLAYVQSLHTPGDWGIKSSGWSKVGRWLTGLGSDADQLGKPFGIALDETGSLCLTDTARARVIYLDRFRKRVLSWERIGRLQFVAPVAVAKVQGTFFVADAGLGEVLIFDEQGQGLVEVKKELVRPSGLAISGNRLFVADPPGHCVAVFDLHGNFLFKFGQRGSAPGQFNFPTHIAAAPNGQLLVTDSMNSRVQLFDAAGRFLSAIGDSGDSAGTISRPKGAAIDACGHIYVVDAVSDSLQIFDAASRFLMALGHAGSAPGEFWLPNGIAISADGHIFVADSYNGRVQIFRYVGPR